jgi:hypothetical protein
MKKFNSGSKKVGLQKGLSDAYLSALLSFNAVITMGMCIVPNLSYQVF